MTTAQRPKHAQYRPPSAAARWLSCPKSVTVVPQYHRDETDHSLKGEKSHTLLENGIIFGLTPDSDDADIDLNVIGVLQWVKDTRHAYGPKCQLFAEQTYDIPQTGEHGTCDITFVTPKVLHIADYKNGFVEVEVRMNAQMMVYLLGAIAKFGEREKYYISVLQPNYDHIEGPYRTYEVTQSDLDWFVQEVKYAMQSDEFKAGKHCKKSYCDHRGACATFLAWAQTNAADAWFTSEINAITDDQLAQALDHAEILQGIRDELRKEAMRRILNMDRKITGYKVVKSRQDRGFINDKAAAEAREVAVMMGAKPEDLYEKKPVGVVGIENFVKHTFKHMGNGAWKKAWENNLAKFVTVYSGGLTLDKATGGRPSHTRGSEFGNLKAPDNQPQITQII